VLRGQIERERTVRGMIELARQIHAVNEAVADG
jgi:hypothetical protein